MNQELKHRLIGAVVVTALATIFIPMLFDDPIDDTGQLVSELKIPTEPLKSGENPENKSPDNTVTKNANFRHSRHFKLQALISYKLSNSFSFSFVAL